MPSTPRRRKVNDGTDHGPRARPKISRARRPAKMTLMVIGKRKIATFTSNEPRNLNDPRKDFSGSGSKSRATTTPTITSATTTSAAGAIADTIAINMMRTMR